MAQRLPELRPHYLFTIRPYAVAQRLAVVAVTPYFWPICFHVRPCLRYLWILVCLDSVASQSMSKGRARKTRIEMMIVDNVVMVFFG